MRRILSLRRWSDRRWGVCCISATVIFLAGAGAAGRAQGSCIEPQSSVLWSYPADGAGGIPTNAQLLVSSSGSIGLPSLNGVVLAASPSGVFALGELTPRTTYRVTWSWEGFSSISKSVSFTTGDGPLLDDVPVPSAVEVTRSPSVAGGRCPLVPSQGCFDTGPPARVRFDPGPAPVAWIVDSVSCFGRARSVWPAECGPPLLEREDRILCASLQLSDGVHVGSATGVICSAPKLPPNVSLPTNSGCTSEWPPQNARLLTSEDGVACSSSADACSPAQDETPIEVSAPVMAAVTPAAESSGCALSARAGSAGLTAALLCLLRVRRREPALRG